MVYQKRFKAYSAGKNTRTARTRMAVSSAQAARSAALARRRAVVPGVTRTGGYYARFGPNSDENKFFDTAISALADATGEVPGTGGQLCLIPQNDTQSGRDGRKCTITSIFIKGHFAFSPGAGTTAADVVHLYVVLDKQCNGGAAAVSDVLTSTSVGTSFNNLANVDRFTILKHWKVRLQSGAGVSTAYGQDIHFKQWYKKCNIPLFFSGTTGAITEIKSNNVFLICGSAGNTDDLCYFDGQCRIRFKG